MSDAPEPSERDPDEDLGEEEPRGTRREASRGLLGGIAAGLLDPETTLRRGQQVLGGVTRGTKEEIVRIVSAEVRNFLDKMDVVDLLQRVVHGLELDVSMQVRFRRNEDGTTRTEVRREGEAGSGAEPNGDDGEPEG
ncbi:MAG: hypothetical protein D6705_06980 [Deltaproteobacteria bacterium]|nr:MAG: hypothetical protein D6705_06980 [Deltaproteobacteria bacterium]